MAWNAATIKTRFGQLLGVIPKDGNRAFGAKRSATHTHQGVDVGGPRGAPVWSPVYGTVTHASNALADGFGGYGRHVVIRQGDDGPWFLFAHLDSLDRGGLVSEDIEAGDLVEPGDLVGTVGDSCFDTSDPSRVCKGVHLHMEVSANKYPQGSEDKRIDPVEWLSDQIQNLEVGEPATTAAKPAKKKKKKKKAARARMSRESGLAMVWGVILSVVMVAIIGAKLGR